MENTHSFKTFPSSIVYKQSDFPSRFINMERNYKQLVPEVFCFNKKFKQILYSMFEASI